MNLVIKYTLQSDGMTEIHKTLSLDIPVIQPFHANFDILPHLVEDGGMPNPFIDGEYYLPVSQSWLLLSSITRLGSEKLEVQHISVTGTFKTEDMSIDAREVGSIPSLNQPAGINSKELF